MAAIAKDDLVIQIGAEPRLVGYVDHLYKAGTIRVKIPSTCPKGLKRPSQLVKPKALKNQLRSEWMVVTDLAEAQRCWTAFCTPQTEAKAEPTNPDPVSPQEPATTTDGSDNWQQVESNASDGQAPSATSTTTPTMYGIAANAIGSLFGIAPEGDTGDETPGMRLPGVVPPAATVATPEPGPLDVDLSVSDPAKPLTDLRLPVHRHADSVAGWCVHRPTVPGPSVQVDHIVEMQVLNTAWRLFLEQDSKDQPAMRLRSGALVCPPRRDFRALLHLVNSPQANLCLLPTALNGAKRDLVSESLRRQRKHGPNGEVGAQGQVVPGTCPALLCVQRELCAKASAQGTAWGAMHELCLGSPQLEAGDSCGWTCLETRMLAAFVKLEHVIREELPKAAVFGQLLAELRKTMLPEDNARVAHARCHRSAQTIPGLTNPAKLRAHLAKQRFKQQLSVDSTEPLLAAEAGDGISATPCLRGVLGYAASSGLLLPEATPPGETPSPAPASVNKQL